MNAFIGPIGILLSLIMGLVACQAQTTSPVLKGDETERSQAQSTREMLLAKSILSLLQQHHLRVQPVNDDTAVTAFDMFLSHLDPQKLYLLHSNVETLRQQAKVIDDQLHAGQFKLAHEAGALRRERVALVSTWVKALLAQPFNLTLDESIELSRKKRVFAQHDDELRDRWRRILKLEALILMNQEQKAAVDKTTEKGDAKATSGASSGPATDTEVRDAPSSNPVSTAGLTDAERESNARAKLMKRYTARFERIAKETQGDDVERFLNAFVQVYDPHTVYLPPYRKENLDIRISGSLEGIGAALRSEDGTIKVQRIVPGSASWRQGQLKAEDVIIAVAQDGEDPVDVVEARLRDIVQLIRGKKGTVVHLTVRKPDGKVVVISITRDVVWLEAGYAKAGVIELEGIDGQFAYIDVPKFYGNIRGRKGANPPRRVSSDIHLALNQLKAKGVRGLVLDVRGNSGGLLSEASHLTGLFIKQGPVVQMRNAGGQQKVLRDKDSKVVFDGPVVIMIDRFSASASEIITSALQAYGRAIIVGGTTYGKGTVQQIHSLDRVVDVTPPLENPLGSLKITRYQFYGIDGASIQLRGVMPDIELPDQAGHLESGEREKEYAIPWGTVNPASYNRWPASWDVPRIRDLSLKRQAQNPVFNKISKRTKLLTQRRDKTLETLEQTAWHQQREQEETELEALQPEEKVRLAVHPIVYIQDDDTPQDAQDVRVKQWIEKVEGDPWLEEALRIVNDMATP